MRTVANDRYYAKSQPRLHYDPDLTHHDAGITLGRQVLLQELTRACLRVFIALCTQKRKSSVSSSRCASSAGTTALASSEGRP